MLFSKNKSAKNALRAQLLKKRADITAPMAQISARMMVTHTLSIVPKTAKIAGYSAMRGELDIETLMKVLAERGHTMALPVVAKKKTPLIFRQWTADTQLIEGEYGVQTPPETALTIMPDVLLVPVLGYDMHCNRLGYGGGYYDRTIAALKKQNPKLLSIGMAYSLQQTAKLPKEKHDQTLDMIITETGVIKPT